MTGTIVLFGLFVGSYALKAVGPLLLGGRTLPPTVIRLSTLLPAALLAALVTTSALGQGSQLVLDARLAGLAAAAVALRLRTPFVGVVVVAAAVTAVLRAVT